MAAGLCPAALLAFDDALFTSPLWHPSRHPRVVQGRREREKDLKERRAERSLCRAQDAAERPPSARHSASLLRARDVMCSPSASCGRRASHSPLPQISSPSARYDDLDPAPRRVKERHHALIISRSPASARSLRCRQLQGRVQTPLRRLMIYTWRDGGRGGGTETRRGGSRRVEPPGSLRVQIQKE